MQNDDVMMIYTKDLAPGMILAENLRDLKSGILLVKEGAVLDKSIIQSVFLFAYKEKYAVYSVSVPDDVKDAQEETAPEEEKVVNKVKSSSNIFEAGKTIDIESHLTPLPERISKEAQNVYKDSLNAIKFFYEKPEIITSKEIYNTMVTAGKITGEILRDPQILLQISVLKAFDNYTFSHAVHVAIYASTLAKFLNFPKEDIEQICLAALLHDIGKVDIPKQIINKPGELTPEEFVVMKEHVTHSYRRVKEFDNLSEDVLKAIHQHHERMDGEGYPRQLRGDEIHKWARVIAVADVYDAVTTDRVYQNSLLPHVGAEVIMGSVGQLDYEYIQAFFQNMPIYPVGSKVRLSTGEKGVVSGSYPSMHIRPVVDVTDDGGDVVRRVFLSEELETFIVEVLHE